MAGVSFKLWGPNWQGTGQTDSSGVYEIDVTYPLSSENAKFFIQVLENNRPASLGLGFRIDAVGCDAGTGMQRYLIDWDRR